MDLERPHHPPDARSAPLGIRTLLTDDHTRAELILTGEADRSTAPRLHEAIRRLLREQHLTTIDLNASALTILDLSGLRGLLRCRAEAVARGCRLVLISPGPAVLTVLRISGLLEWFGLPPSAGPPTTAAPAPRPAPGHDEIIARSEALRRAAVETRARARDMRADNEARHQRIQAARYAPGAAPPA
ncbi:STAS domain-containing protein [Actinoplanes sp. NPDC048967]|uniref:STAS domain-containing protein n=1 Tax=Actinoplanes sp. NPDC048967 TaxID=3155269 RepID=UPI00340B7424